MCIFTQLRNCLTKKNDFKDNARILAHFRIPALT